MITINEIELRNAVKKFFKTTIVRQDLDNFKYQLKILIDKIKNTEEEREEHLKNYLRDFLNQTFYRSTNFLVNTKSNIDLAIYLGTNSKNNIGVIFEIKSPSNNSEMISKNDINKKAFHELVLYYLQERKNGNFEIKHLIITNGYEWFIFDANVFDKHIYENSKIKNLFETKIKDNKDNVWFYDELKTNFEKLDLKFEAVYFNLKDYNSKITNNTDEDLLILYKIFSPAFLLKQSIEDKNALNKEFYEELLHILGLEEVQENQKVIIRRKANHRNEGSLLELTIDSLKTLNKLNTLDESYGQNEEEKLFNAAFELCITWINRILFLKLLEAQLFNYHDGDKKYLFLNSEKIKDFDDLFMLFHKVLAIPTSKREGTRVIQEFGHLPYLNSSLFELTELENKTIPINTLNDNVELEFWQKTVLKSSNKSKLRTIDYLLNFLSAYDFSTEGNDIIQDSAKPLINASVLGKVFEKINGYKDGAFFTPSFITTFMARETIRQIIVQKFNDAYSKEHLSFSSFEAVKNFCVTKNETSDIKKLNEIVNSIKICDPAVGSGHFLVSCLNELIAAKAELGILADEKGNRIPNFFIETINDELVITDFNGNFVNYKIKNGKPVNNKIHILQKSLFNEKRNIIENCLFGVDINPKSVLIARLRLWIELLKNAYYKEETNYTELETLPNIDINIKVGDSLISKFRLTDKYTDFDASTQSKIRKIITDYKEKVIIYKHVTDRHNKESIEREIEKLKKEFIAILYTNDPDYKKLKELEAQMGSKPLLFNLQDKDNWNKQFEKINQKYEQVKKRFEEKINTIRQEAFEWRLEFPEVLDDDANYIGFDIVIGNPPYIQLQKDGGKLADKYKNMGYYTFDRMGDVYTLFFERGLMILRNHGLLCYITSNKWMRAGYGQKLREFFLKHEPLLLIDIGPNVFENATVDTNILLIRKLATDPSQNFSNSGSTKQNKSSKKSQNSSTGLLRNDLNLKAVALNKKYDNVNLWDELKNNAVTMTKLSSDVWFIGSDAEQRLKEKIERIGKPLKDWDVKIYRGVLTGLNDAFIIDKQKRDKILANCRDDAERQRTEAILKPILRGRDIKRYYYEWQELWLILIPAGWTNANRGNLQPENFVKKIYPSLMNYLIEYEEKAKNRYDKGDYWWELRHCDYYPEFEKEKVVWGGVITTKDFFKLRMSFCDKGIYINAPANMMIVDNLKYILGFCNSTINNWYYNKFIGTILHKDGIRFYLEDILKLFIPPITDKNSSIVAEIEQLVDNILAQKKLNKHADTSNLEVQIDMLVYQLYDLTADEIALVESYKTTTPQPLNQTEPAEEE